jgi:hypothetical protein
MRREASPTSCPACGGNRVRPIFWGWQFLGPREKADAEAGQVILGSRHESGVRFGRSVPRRHPQVLGAPDWACLDCEPGWAEVHDLAIEEEKLQEAKAGALQACNLEAAWAYFGRQDEINDRIVERVRRLTSVARGEPESGE